MVCNLVRRVWFQDFSKTIQPAGRKHNFPLPCVIQKAGVGWVIDIRLVSSL